MLATHSSLGMESLVSITQDNKLKYIIILLSSWSDGRQHAVKDFSISCLYNYILMVYRSLSKVYLFRYLLIWSIWVSRAFTTLIASDGSWPCIADLRAAVKLSTCDEQKDCIKYSIKIKNHSLRAGISYFLFKFRTFVCVKTILYLVIIKIYLVQEIKFSLSQ